MILDQDLTGDSLRQNILDLYQNREERLRMAACARAAGKRDALDQIVHLVEQYCK